MTGMETDIPGTTEDSILPHVAMFLVTSWLILIFFAFWWFEYRLLQPFVSDEEHRAVFFDGEKTMQALAATIASKQSDKGMATVVHFWDPDCPCNKLNESHVHQIIKDYGERGVKFVIVTQNESSLAKARQRFNDPYL